MLVQEVCGRFAVAGVRAVAEQRGFPLQGYTFDTRARRYRYARTGQFVARNRITELLDRSIAGRERRLFAGVRGVMDGRIRPDVWLTRTKTLLKRQYLQDAALAAGGWDQLTFHDYGRIGGKLQAQYRRLEGMRDGIADGTVSEAQALSRMKMYAGNARAEYYEVERERLPATPADKIRIERRRLGAKDKGNCDDCLRYADTGWQMEGRLPVPTQGSVCNGQCRCDLVRKEVPTQEVFDWISTRRG